MFDFAALVGYIHASTIAGPVVGGLMGYFGAMHTSRSNERIARDKEDAARAQRRKAAEEALADDLTKRFQALMNGYEVRIGDLTEEVSSLRKSLHALRNELNMRVMACAGCPHFTDTTAHDGTD